MKERDFLSAQSTMSGTLSAAKGLKEGIAMAICCLFKAFIRSPLRSFNRYFSQFILK